MKNATKKIKLALIASAVMGVASSAMAAVPTEVTTSISDMKADGLTVAGSVLAAIIAIAAVKFIRKGL